MKKKRKKLIKKNMKFNGKIKDDEVIFKLEEGFDISNNKTYERFNLYYKLDILFL